MTEKPSTTLPATVEKIIKPIVPTEPERAQIVIEGAEQLWRIILDTYDEGLAASTIAVLVHLYLDVISIPILYS